ncbi:MAG: zinc-binding dehydrogenase [Phycisphaerae bacterium]|nr:zinc-binding dehydrogenase [Phycisphaerae bacterium]
MKAVTYNIKPLGWVTCKWLRHLWRGCLVSGLNGFSLRQMDIPELPGDDWVRLRTLLGGVCGSDAMLVDQKQAADSLLQAYTSMPMILGHENVAVVEEVGPAVDDSWVGRRVLVEPTLCCVPRGTEPICPRCEAGEFGACENFSGAMGGSANLPAGVSIGYNSRTGGSWGEHFVAHHSQLLAVDDSVSDEHALLTDPFACSLHGVLRADLTTVKNVLIYGTGVLGMGTIATLRALGYTGRIEAMDRYSYQADVAANLGADDYYTLPGGDKWRFEQVARRTGATLQHSRFGNYILSGGYDLVFDCVGSRQSVMECMKWTRARGQVILIGTLQKGLLDLTPIWFRELKVVGCYGRQMEHYQGGRKNTYKIVLDWITEGRMNLDGMLTHIFRLGDYKKALRAALYKADHESIKVAFDFR